MRASFGICTAFCQLLDRACTAAISLTNGTSCVRGADPDIGYRAFGVRGSIAIAVLLYAELFLT